MKNILLIIVILFCNLDFFGQENQFKESSDRQDTADFKLEIDKKSYTLYLTRTNLETGYFIMFKDKRELEKFLLKGLELSNIPSEKHSETATKIELTHKDLKFCKSKGTKQPRVIMEKIDGSTDEVLISSTQMDTEKDESDWISGSRKFSKSDLNQLYKSVFGMEPVESGISIQVYDDDTGYFGLSGSGSSGLLGGSSNGGSYWLENRRATRKPKPAYLCQNSEGSVVVSISVDQTGRVVSAEVGEKGTTSFAPCLLQEAMDASLRTRFNMSETAPKIQTGMITFNFFSFNKQNQKRNSFHN